MSIAEMVAENGWRGGIEASKPPGKAKIIEGFWRFLLLQAKAKGWWKMKTNRQEWEGVIPRHILDVWEEKKGLIPSNARVHAMYLITLVLIWVVGASVSLVPFYNSLVTWTTPPGQKSETGLCLVVCVVIAVVIMGISDFLLDRILETREKKRLRLLEFRRFVERFAKCVSLSEGYFPVKADELAPLPFDQICDDNWRLIVKGVFTDQEMTGELYCLARLKFRAKQFLDRLADEVVEPEALHDYSDAKSIGYALLNEVHTQRRDKLTEWVSWAVAMGLVDESEGLAEFILRAASRLIEKTAPKPPKEEKKEPPKPELVAALPKRVVEIRCPVEGTFYKCPNGERPVKVGDSVTPGSVVGRLTRKDGQSVHITAGVAGQVTHTVIADGTEAQVGDILFMVESTEPEK